MQTFILIVVLLIPITALGYSYLNKKKIVNAKVRFNYKPIAYDGLLAIELEFVRLVNEHRINLGLNPLIAEKLACEVCQKRLEDDIKQNIESNHYYWATMISDAKANDDSGSHIVANNFVTALGLFNGYISSQGHKEALENKHRTHIGTSFKEKRNHTILTKYN